jgi:hypothetical protein
LGEGLKGLLSLAVGRYEVYVAKAELCVKPNKIP